VWEGVCEFTEGSCTEQYKNGCRPSISVFRSDKSKKNKQKETSAHVVGDTQIFEDQTLLSVLKRLLAE
jgi:hypothetical protein